MHKIIIDEKQEKFYISYHNLIEITLKLNDTNYQRGGTWEEKQYYKQVVTVNSFTLNCAASQQLTFDVMMSRITKYNSTVKIGMHYTLLFMCIITTTLMYPY